MSSRGKMPIRFHIGLWLVRVAGRLLKLDGKQTPYVIQETDNKKPEEHLVLGRGLVLLDNERSMLYCKVNGRRWYY